MRLSTNGVPFAWGECVERTRARERRCVEMPLFELRVCRLGHSASRRPPCLALGTAVSDAAEVQPSVPRCQLIFVEHRGTVLFSFIRPWLHYETDTHFGFAAIRLFG